MGCGHLGGVADLRVVNMDSGADPAGQREGGVLLVLTHGGGPLAGEQLPLQHHRLGVNHLHRKQETAVRTWTSGSDTVSWRQVRMESAPWPEPPERLRSWRGFPATAALCWDPLPTGSPHRTTSPPSPPTRRRSWCRPPPCSTPRRCTHLRDREREAVKAG